LLLFSASLPASNSVYRHTSDVKNNHKIINPPQVCPHRRNLCEGFLLPCRTALFNQERVQFPDACVEVIRSLKTLAKQSVGSYPAACGGVVDSITEWSNKTDNLRDIADKTRI
jgi:hypothetical protein